MAIHSRNKGSIALLQSGIRAAGLGAGLDDTREGLLVLPLLWRTAIALGCDPATEFRSAADEVGGRALTEFAARDPKDQTIEEMGYVEVDDEFGFRYERTW
jgi:hypothetical protein